ncbi:MAG: hypothetical protein MI748_16795 [Opitutales bacterium]|nr:hypothetical protein [Opitutales bacterium]
MKHAQEFNIHYDYDNKGRLESIQSTHTPGANDKYFYAYAPESNFVESIQYQFVSQNTELTASYVYSPDAGQVTQLTNSIDGDTSDGTPATTLSKYSYTHHDDLGMIETVTHEGDAYAGQEFFSEYTYGEDRYQLSDVQNYSGTDTTNKTSPISNENWSYSYDHMGNRVSSTEGTSNLTYTANALNQYDTITGLGTLTYDNDGNLTDDNNWIYTWDALSRLVKMEPKTISIGSKQ